MSESYEELAEKLQEREEDFFELSCRHEQLLEKSCYYIGHRVDNIDVTLAHYIKQFPEREKLRIMFLRESEGVYQFGQRKVYLKIEKGNTIKVRVGGGFMHIDDFIDQYQDLEIQRIERRDVFNRFRQKASLQRIVSEKSANGVEILPVQMP